MIFYRGAYKSIKHGALNMDVLVALGTSCAWGYGMLLFLNALSCPVNKVAKNMGMEMGHSMGMKDKESMAETMRVMDLVHNFEMSSTLLTIILLGKLLEAVSKRKTVAKLEQLSSLTITDAELLDQDEEEFLEKKRAPKVERVAVELLQVGDLISIKIGAKVAVDGIVIEGKGTTDESMLTGESRQVVKEENSKVYGGSLLVQGNLVVRVLKSAEDSSLHQIMKMVEDAQSSKAPIQDYADRLAAVFVPAIIALAVLAWFVWFSITYFLLYDRFDDPGKRFQFAFNFGIATIVVACPCALGLATPTAVMVASGIAANYGILIKGAEILQKIHSIDTVVFDKTGTLTSGAPKVKDFLRVPQIFKTQMEKEEHKSENFLLMLALMIEK